MKVCQLQGSTVPGTETTPNSHGVYEAQVEVNGVPKSGNNGVSSFFPKNMSAQQVVDGINEAYANKVHLTGNTYRGTTASGMTVDIYIDSNGQIISAFPQP